MKKLVKLFMIGILTLSMFGLTACSHEEVKIENVATDYDKKTKEEMDKSEIQLIDFYHTTSDKVFFHEENKKDTPSTVFVLSLNNANSWAKDLLEPKIEIGDYKGTPETIGYSVNDTRSLLFLSVDQILEVTNNFNLELSIDNEQEDGVLTVKKEIVPTKINLETKNELNTVGEIAKLGENSYAMKINSALDTDLSNKKQSTKILNLFVWGNDISFNNKDFKLIDVNGKNITEELKASFDIMKIYDNYCGVTDNKQAGLFGRIQITTTFKTDNLSDKELSDFLLRVNDSSIEINGNKFSFKDSRQNYN